MKKITMIGMIAGTFITGLYAATNSANTTTTPQTTGEITNYQAVLNTVLAHKNEIFLAKINNLFDYISNYILETGDINVNEEKIKQHFNIKDNLFKNFDGKNNMKIIVNDTGVYFENLYDKTPSKEELYFLQNAPNFPSLMKLYKDSNGKYLLYMPFSPNVANFIAIVEELKTGTFPVPEKYTNEFQNVSVSQRPPSSHDVIWAKPNKNGTLNIYTYDHRRRRWQNTAVILNNGTISPISSNIVKVANKNTNMNNVYPINPKDIENKIVVAQKLSQVAVDKLQQGAIVIIQPNPNDNNHITAAYIKVDNTLQPLSKENLSQITKEAQREIMQHYLNDYSALYVTFTEKNYDASTKTFTPKGRFAFGGFKTKGMTFKLDPVTGQEIAFLKGNADSYIRSPEGAKVFGYIQSLQHSRLGATVTIIALFKNATPDIKDPVTGRPLYNGKVRQVPFGVSGYGIGLYYAWGDMCYGCYSYDYRYLARALLGWGREVGIPQSIRYQPKKVLAKIQDWMIGVWKFHPEPNFYTFNSFELFKVENGKPVKLFNVESDPSSYFYLRGKGHYNPSEDYLAFGGGMHILDSYGGINGSFDVNSPGIIRNGNNAGFRGWVGGLVIVPDILSDTKIIDIVKYLMPNLIKE